jgi:hypothetical protein
MRFLSLLLLTSVLSGCATNSTSCRGLENAFVSEMIYFGMAKPSGGSVTQTEWSEFLRTVVTPRFPSGLTVWPAAGQWRGKDGEVVREASYVLNLLHAPNAKSEAEVVAIVTEYKKQFEQEAVLRVRSDACVSL